MGAPSDLSAGAECLNEVRSPQERRLLAGHLGGSYTQPQRSPLPTGAETGADGGVHEAPVDASTKSAPHRSGDRGSPARTTTAPGLNEVRSPQERRLRVAVAARLPVAASTKSAPHRSGDPTWGRVHG